MSAADIDKIPPQSLDAELSTLGSMLVDREAIRKVRDMLNAEDFYRESNQKLFQAICRLSDKHEPADLTTIGDELLRTDDLDIIGGLSYVVTVIGTVPTAVNAEAYAGIVRETSQKRKLIALASEIAGLAYGGEADSSEIGESARQRIAQITERLLPATIKKYSEAEEALSDELDARKNRTRGEGAVFGIKRLDDILGGIRPGQIAIIAARPGAGKSCLLRQLAHETAHKGRASLFFSLEMADLEMAEREYQARTNITPNSKYLTGGMDGDDCKAMFRVMSEDFDLPRYLCCDVSDLTKIGSLVRRYATDHPGGLVIIDYLQLLRTQWDTRMEENRRLEFILRELKSWTTEYKIPMAIASQLSRESVKNGESPKLHHLRGSGSIEQDAHKVIFLHPTAKREKGEPQALNLIVAKNRGGVAGVAISAIGDFAHMTIKQVDEWHTEET